MAGRRLSTSGTEGSSGVLERRTWEALGLLPKGRWRVRAEAQIETGQMDGKRRGGGYSKIGEWQEKESRAARERERTGEGAGGGKKRREEW